MRPTDKDYYQRRLEQERARAERATDPVARQLHTELADRYMAMFEPVAVAA